MTSRESRRARRGAREPRPRSRRAIVFLLGAVLLTGCGSGTQTGLVAIGSGVRGRSGLKATVYAAGLRKMSAFAVDDRGRLWVTTSAATDHSADGLYLVSKPGARPVKVVAHLNAPLGLTWYGGKLYVASIGRVEAFSGLQGTHFRERKTILDGPARGASNNSLVAHGGRLFMSVSTTCDHCKPTSSWAASIVSFRPDGSDLRVCARGVRAAFGLAFYPGGSDLFASMNQRDDLGGRTPGDWLVLVRQGENWRFPSCYGQGGPVCKDVPRPVAVLDKHAAAGAIAFVGGAALVTEWAKGKVLRIALTKTTAGYEGTVSTFLTGLRNPLPAATLRDGAVLVGDWTTGKVYRIVT